MGLVSTTRSPSPYNPPENDREPLGTKAIERFEDLVLNKQVMVWNPKRDAWGAGVVYKIRDIPASASRNGNTISAKRQACVRMTGGSIYFYDTSWDRAQTRVRACVIDDPAHKNLRQAAKPIYFGGVEYGTCDGMTPKEIFDTYCRIQREEELAYVLVGPGAVPRLNARQLSFAKMMWSSFLAQAQADKRNEDARREAIASGWDPYPQED